MADTPEPFSTYQARHDVRPPWHAGPNGERWHQVMGLEKDAIADGATLAARSRLVSLCPDDALPLHGAALGIPSTPGELPSEYRARLRTAWALAEWRGTRKGIVDALSGILTPLIGLSATPGNWIEVHESFTAGWGRHTAFGSARLRWANVVIRQPHPFGTDFAFSYGDGTLYGSGKAYGPNGDPRVLRLLVDTVKRMKPAHAWVEWIAVVLAGDIKHTNAATDGDPTPGSKVAYLSVSI